MTARLLGAVVGLLVCGFLPSLPGPVAVLALAVAGGALLLPACAGARFAAGMLLGAALAAIHGHGLDSRRLPEDCVRQNLWLSGRVVSLPQQRMLGEGTRQQRFELAVTDVRPARCRGPRRVLLGYYGPLDVLPGETWQFRARLKRPWGLVNPGSANLQAWFAQSGIDATGSAGRGARRLAPAAGLGALHHRLRARISTALSQQPLAPSTRGVLQAVTVADRSGLDRELWRLFQLFGVTHLLVISGLHIGLVAASGYLLGRVLALGLELAGPRMAGPRTAGPRTAGPRMAGHFQVGLARLCRLLPGALALVLAGAYTALAGFSLPTVRALLMLACVVVAAACWRRAGSWRNLLLAAALLLVSNPLAGLGSGFWLSFGAVACLLWLAQWRQGQGRWRGALVTHAYMSLAMLPLCAWWFGGFSQVAALANLLLVPLLGCYVVPLALLGALLELCGIAAVAEALWAWAAIPVEALLPLAQVLAGSQPAWLYRAAAPGPLEALLALVAVVLVVPPGHWRLRLLLPVLLLPLLLPPSVHRSVAAGAVHVLVMDVGQGTAVLVYDRQRALLYDTGGVGIARRVVLPLLQQRGISRLDTLVISHGDADHSAGLETLQDGIPLGRILVGAGVRGGQGEPCRAGQRWQWPGGQVRFDILSPARETRLSRNNGSCVLRVQIAGHSLLLPGDIDAGRERELVRYWHGALSSDWLLAAHHGSATSSSHAWLKQVDPQHVVFTHGYANHFGHPHPAVRERVEAHGARAWSTARQGALELVFQPGVTVRVIAHRSLQRRHWL